MNILPSDWRIEIIGEPLAVTRNEDGTRTLLRPLRYRFRRKEHVVHAGLITDFSSWPRAAVLWLFPLALWYFTGDASNLWYWLVPLCMPSYEKTDITGVIHDYNWRTAEGLRELLYTNIVWVCGALTGKNVHNRAHLIQGISGYIGLAFAAFWKAAIQKMKLKK